MSDDLILVQYGTLEEATSNVQTAIRTMNQQLDALKAYLAAIKELWTGDAGDSYKALQAKWDQTALDLNQVLSKIPTELQNAQQQYQAVEKQNAGVWT